MFYFIYLTGNDEHFLVFEKALWPQCCSILSPRSSSAFLLGVKTISSRGCLSMGCMDKSLFFWMLFRPLPFIVCTLHLLRRVTRIAFIMTMAMNFPTQLRGPNPKGWKQREGTCGEQRGEQLRQLLLHRNNTENRGGNWQCIYAENLVEIILQEQQFISHWQSPPRSGPALGNSEVAGVVQSNN